MQPARSGLKRNNRLLGVLPALLALAYIVDRLLKLLAVAAAMREPALPLPHAWPSVTLLQPLTHGASDLRGALACRARLRYGGHVQHLLLCDAADAQTQAICQAWLAEHPQIDAQLVSVPASDRRPPAIAAQAIATKIEKLNVGLPQATGEVLCFVDDDILLRPDALARLLPYLEVEGAGAVFGLACYVNWSNVASSLLSAFVNANALLAYLPVARLTEPFTITGHLYALKRTTFAAAGGLDGLDGRIDDDHELARRVRRLGLRNVQSTVVYDVDNRLGTLYDYANQMRRWFIIPRQTMLPYLTAREQALTLAASAGNLIPPLLAALTLLPSLRRHAGRALVVCLAAFATVYLLCERLWLGRTAPLLRWPLLPASALLAPLQALAATLGGDSFTWRGQRVHLRRGGQLEVVGNEKRTQDSQDWQN